MGDEKEKKTEAATPVPKQSASVPDNNAPTPQRTDLGLPEVKPAPELTGQATTMVDNQATKVGVDQDTERLVLVHPKYSKDSIRDGIENGYLDSIAEFSRNIHSLQKAKEEAEKNNAEAQRRAKRSAMIAGIGDAFSSLANLIGVSHNASNQSPVDNQSKYIARDEADRQDRLKSMQDINNNLDRLKRDRQEATLAMQLGLAKYDANRRAQQEAKELEDKKLKARLKESNNKMITDAAKLELEKSTVDAKNNLAAAQAGYWKRKTDTLGKEKDNKKGEKVTIAYEKEGKPYSITLPAKTLSETSKRNITILRDEIAQVHGYKGWSDYEDSMDSNDRKYRKLPQSAKRDLRGLETIFSDDDAINIANVYGVRSPRFMALLEYAQNGQSGETPTAPATTKEDTNPLNGFSNRPKTENSILNSL